MCEVGFIVFCLYLDVFTLCWCGIFYFICKRDMKKLLAVFAALLLAFSFGVFADNHEEETLDIVATASANENFSTLVELVVAAGLVEALQAEGPFTVFAPVNEAFAALDEETVAFLLSEEGKETLASILTFHVVDGLALAADVEDGLGLVTLNGQKLYFAVSEDGVSVNGANIVATDVLASNGVIHVIDAVLLPATEEVVATAYDADMVERVEGGLVAANLQDAIDYLFAN
jgi:uncharacterized surface protein with fasciclin (FAS1) repeats